MRQLTIITLPTIKRFGLWGALLLTFSIPFPLRVNSVAIVIFFSLFTLLTLATGEMDKKFLKSPAFFLISLLFVIDGIGLIFTSDASKGWSDIERSAFQMTFLLLVYQFRVLNISLIKLIVSFTIGCFTITICGLVYAMFFLKGGIQKEVFESGHTYFADIILIHPLYLSTYFIFVFFFLLETVRTKRDVLNSLSKVGMATALIFIFGILLFLRSQMSLVIFAMLLVMYAIIVLKRRAWLVTFLLFTVALLVFLLDSSRVATFFDTYGKNVSSALDQRFSVWRGTIEGIKTAPFFGAGTGGEQQLINKGYAITGYQEGIGNSYNAHNQYLQFLARNGIPELLCFLALLFYSFQQSLKMPNYTFLMFNMAVTLIMFTESFLDVQRGIVFFYFFLCAFIYLPYESTSQPSKSV